jgi:hypothetical protein
MMLAHWVRCPHTHFRVSTRQLLKSDETPVTGRIDEGNIISAIPGLYRKLCSEVHRFSLGGAEEREVVIPKAVGSFNEADRVALANLVASFHWPYKVGEDYDVSGL